MALSYLLDTNILSEPCRPTPNRGVIAKLERFEGQLATSAVAWHELCYGQSLLAPSRRKEAIAAYLDSLRSAGLPVLPYSAEAAEWHAREHARLAAKGLTPPFADGQIAAIAHTQGLTLVTRNGVDFKHFSGLKVQNWFSSGPTTTRGSK